MKHLVIVIATLALSASLYAEELVQAVDLGETPLTVTAVPGQPYQLLVELPNPGISSPVYALKGRIRYAGVDGEAFLQLDNDFGERGTFFTKSLAPDGPLGKISGTSDWRPFVLPFYANTGDESDGAALVPSKLTLSLYLPAAGTVTVADVGVYQYAAGEDPLRMSVAPGAQWFGDRMAGLIGAIAGTALGLWGALIGILSSRGKARSFALSSASVLLVVGIASLIAGAVAVAAAQPYSVTYTLLLMGALIIAVTGMLRRGLVARYEEVELKRMQSMDA